MPTYTVSLSSNQAKAFQAQLGQSATITDWLQDAALNKARKCIDRVVLEVSDKNPLKLNELSKELIVQGADLTNFRKIYQV